MDRKPSDAPLEQICSRPRTRREWRSLTTGEKKDYMSAAMCLYTKPSQLNGEGSLLDDLTWVHIMQDDPDSFSLGWPRNTDELPAQRMIEPCSYLGIACSSTSTSNTYENTVDFKVNSRPYWDWTTDWQNLSSSSIWDDETGFGGEANKDFNAGCVTGLFGSVQALYTQNGSILPHCLSRSFHNYESGEGGSLSGDFIKPAAMKRLAQAKNYGSFRYMLEGFAHNFFHYQIDGDLNTSAAPNDPLFWLHHVQLDRLWWLWQEEDARARQNDYSESEQQPSSSGPANLADVLQYEGLARAIRVGDVMTTESGPLCYRYSSVA
ncbi:Tyrosinase [Apiospora kogelbergensis]|uniref:Tyrosinase n=1 Tax=Apiospora kogelbergensis TaxID=1337665 RepID=UPI0031308E11